MGWLAAAEELAPEALLLARIKVRAAENLQSLPNYTCLETIERSQRRAAGRRYELSDVIRLEVGYVNRKEVFAWPGSGKFEDTDITEMVQGGTIGNGSFALHVSGIFLSDGASFTHVGERDMGGRKLLQFDYRVPMFRSGFRMRVKPAMGIVGYHGSFWVDPQSLDLARLEILADEIPPQLPVKSASQSLRYQRVSLGERDFLLPLEGEMILTDLRGNESRNRLSFSKCRQFAGESVLRFDDVPEDGGAPVTKKEPEQFYLPADLDVELELETPIEGGVTAIGDVLVARVAREVKRKSVVYVPKGASVLGRVAYLSPLRTARSTGWLVGLDFRRVEFADRYALFYARMNTPLDRMGQVGLTGGAPQVVRSIPALDPRVGLLYIRGETGKIGAGRVTSWRTAKPEIAEQR
jgi:hypothetical protein